MKRLVKKIVLMLTVSMVVCVGTQRIAFADDNTAMNVGVSAIIPENQIDKQQSYFDLLMAPGTEQVLEVQLSNSSDKDITVEVMANTAVTNDNGVVDYSQVETEKDPSLAHSFAEISAVDKEIVIPKKSVKNAKINVKMPKESHVGVIAGGIHITEKESAEESEKGSGVQIKNKFVFVVGVQLRTTESLEGLLPDLALDAKKIIPKQVNYRNFLGINLQNVEPVFIRDLTVEAKVYRGNNQEVLHETTKEHLKMAPNSNFNFGVDWENKEFQGGKYRAVVKATSKDYDKEWTWEEEFTIDAKLAKELNKEAVELDKDYMGLIIMIALGILLLLVIVVIILVIQNNKHKKNSQRNQPHTSSKKHKKSSKR